MHITSSYGEPLAAACRRVGVHPATGSRWILRGVRLRDGRRVRLPATRTPGGWRIRPSDLDAYLGEITADRLGEPEPVHRTPAQRARDLRVVERELAAAGLID